MTRRIDVRILTPFGQESGMGNWRTASRYAQMLRASGINASVFEPSAADDALVSSGQRTVAVVLNAYRSADQVSLCVRGGIPVMVVMTGTDLYGNLRPSNAGQPDYRIAEQAMESAALILALQSEAAAEIQARWPALADRVHTLVQTSPPRRPHAPEVTSHSKTVRFMIAAHFREEKDPRTAFMGFHEAFPEGWGQRADGRRVPVRLIHVGGYRDKTLAQEMMRLSERYPGILIEGPRTHAETMRQMTHVHCLLQPSVSEGGALVIAEAVACRLPIIASDIPAHRSQLGSDYPALFPVRDTEKLATLMRRFIADPGLVASIHGLHPRLQATLATPTHERDELVRLVRRLAEYLPKEAS
jgi:glycosyltransferase involved in cell wall biosynthesis